MCFSSNKQNGQQDKIQLFPKIDPIISKNFALKNQRNNNTALPAELHRKPIQVRNVPKNRSQFGDLNSGAFEATVKRQIQISEYQYLINQFKNSRDKWTDPSFPPKQSSWGVGKQVSWRRINDILPRCKFVSDNFAPSDILQGKIGNCYFLSSLAGLAEKSYRIINIFPNRQINENGIYMARILHKGVFQQVVIDDYFPVNSKGQLLGSLPSGGQ